MNIYTTYTPSHKILYDNFFLKTLPSCFTLNVLEDKEQLCQSGRYFSEGWTITTKKKVDFFVKICEENMGNYFFYSDVDVQFFDNHIDSLLLEEIEDNDIACQDDIWRYCSGVFICKANDRTLNMFRYMKDNYDYADDDQKALNNALFMSKHKMLSRKFFTSGFRRPFWNGQYFDVPRDIVMHHANWTIGIRNKISLLNFVRKEYNKRNRNQ